jgi:hypothetical protein
MSQRKALIRLAASLPHGDLSRKHILSGLSKVASESVEDAFESEEVQKHILDNPEILQWKGKVSNSYRFFKSNKHYYIDLFNLRQNGERGQVYRYVLTVKTITPFGMTVGLLRESVTPSGFVSGGTEKSIRRKSISSFSSTKIPGIPFEASYRTWTE